MDTQALFQEFKEKTEQFYAGDMDWKEYKGLSGFYGSVAQRGWKSNMIRLRMTGGRVTKPKMKFVADMIRKHDVKRMHFTTCSTIQLHDLVPEQLFDIMEGALKNDILTIGGGGNYPRNVVCSALSGVDKNEFFPVLPYAEAAMEKLEKYITAEKMPRKLKVSFCDSPENDGHSTIKDLGFVARPDGKIDVYICGGMGPNHKMGVKVAEAVAPEEIGYYIHAMWLFFRTFGNYENKAKARSRYIQETLETKERFQAEFEAKMKEAYASDYDLKLNVKPLVYNKKGNGTNAPEDMNVIPQKQEGLYAVAYHPAAGFPDPRVFCQLTDAVMEIEDAELRLSGNETGYIINLTGDEAERILSIIKEDNAESKFEYSVSCVGNTICQIGLRDSKGACEASIKAVREAKIPNEALPIVHFSGCMSSCASHQVGKIGFRGGNKKVNDESVAAFVMFVDGNPTLGHEKFAEELGTIQDTKIPEFLVELGRTVAATGMTYDQWYAKHYDEVAKIAKPYID